MRSNRSNLCSCSSPFPFAFTLLCYLTFLHLSHASVLPHPGAPYLGWTADHREASKPVLLEGWTPQPSGRGTIDIIWSCVFTIFLCSWSVLCLNVPAENDSWWEPLWRKLCFSGLGMLGPEFTLQTALGQWISAHRSVKEFEASSVLHKDWPEWTMKHAFFADMGGFILQSPDFVPFPVNAKQVHYLISQGYLMFPTISKRQIEDRNKADALLRAITVLQTLWFVINSVARWIQHLDVTTFELTTLGFIFCTLGTHVCWAHKPADVEVSEILECRAPISHILRMAGDDAKQPYTNTPLDFIGRQEWSWSLWWSFLLNVGRKMHIRFRPKVRPIARFPNDNWPQIPTAGIYALGIVDMMYASIYVAGWNVWFATNIERILWRASTTTILGIVFSYLLIETYAFHIYPSFPKRFRKLFEDTKKTPSRTRTWLSKSTPGKYHRAAMWMRNNSQNRDKKLKFPLKASIPITITGFVYALARAYILMECVVALRVLPPGAYETVNWSNFLPHV